MARFFLAIDPLIIVLASCGLYIITQHWRKVRQTAFLILCSSLLFLEYLPASFNPTADLYKDSPKIYTHLAADPSVRTLAEYPITDFKFAPIIFTYQQVDGKSLLNAGDSRISRGPFDTSIAGLNDFQTIGALKALGIDVITSYGLNPHNDSLVEYYPASAHNKGGIPAIYSYTISSAVRPNYDVLLADKGYDFFVVDSNLVSHRVLLNEGTMRVQTLNKQTSKNIYDAGFSAQALCVGGAAAQLQISQAGKMVWEGSVANTPVRIDFVTSNGTINLHSSCSLDITNLQATPVAD